MAEHVAGEPDDGPETGAETAGAPETEGLEELLTYIRRARRFDFTGYKRPSLARRVTKRMREVGCRRFADYQDYLEVHPEEFAVLFDTVLNNVTSFFRDPPAWQFLAEEVIPRIVTGKAPGAPIRIWSAGCATGQEAYTLAMLLADAVGADEFRSRVKIYGTDADERALAKARQAVYSVTDLEDVPPALRSQHFERHTATELIFHKDLRRQIIFGRHDLVQDAPISRLDLLVCRNTLMYFNAETQSTILERFNFALADGGYLFLGKAETLLTHSPLFRPLDLRLRIFTKLRERQPGRGAAHALLAETDDPPPLDVLALAMELGAVPAIVLDAAGVVVSVNASARSRFGLRLHDVGAALQDLEISYRPLELRSAISEANSAGRAVERKAVRWRVDGTDSLLDVTVTPLQRPDGVSLGTAVTFVDVTEAQELRSALEQSNRSLETAYEELQSTNEELETTNEELQSTIEELETTNEELQSSNEELETTNEELQSTNDELHTVNEELQVTAQLVDRANAYLEGILAGLPQGVVVLDRVGNVQAWSPGSEDLWGLRASEVRGQPFSDLEIGMAVGELTATIQAGLGGQGGVQEKSLPARNRRGQRFTCRVLCTPLVLDHAVDGVILLMESTGGRRPAARKGPTG